MDAHTALVLHHIVDQAPCTKLCIKQHSGLSMSTVLRAIQDLQREGWIDVESHPAPYGGKPHARILPRERYVYGAHYAAGCWTVCRLSLTRQCSLYPHAALPTQSPCYVVGEPQVSTTFPTLAYPTAMAYYLAAHGGGVYIDENLVAHHAQHPACALGDLPSPLCLHHRLTYAQAFAVAQPTQKNRLAAELEVWLGALWQTPRALFWYDNCLHPAEAAAWSALWQWGHGYL